MEILKNVISMICIVFLITSCKKEKNMQHSIEGKWGTIYEVSKKISTKTPGKVIYEYVHPQNEILTIGLEITASSMKFIYGEDDYAKVNYQLLTESSSKVSYIYIVNNKHKIQYKLEKDTLRLIEVSSGGYRPSEESYYSLTETKLLRQK